MKKVLVPLAPGFEEIEALAVVDILRRAGAEVVTAGTAENPIEGRNGIKVLADRPMDQAGPDEFDMIVLPGGAKGTENLKKDDRIKKILIEMDKKKKLVTAICAAPTVLAAAGLTHARGITCHPSVRNAFDDGERISFERVVIDGNIVTSQGPGTAMEFAFKLVEILFGPAKAEEVNSTVLARF